MFLICLDNNAMTVEGKPIGECLAKRHRLCVILCRKHFQHSTPNPWLANFIAAFEELGMRLGRGGHEVPH